MRFIHIADLHCNKERKDQCLTALRIIRDELYQNPDTILLIAGDFWDSTITATSNSGFPEFIRAVKNITDLSDVYMITGTPSHEPAGSLEVFEAINVNVFKYNSFLDLGDFELIMMPEPRKTDFLNSDNIDKAIQKSYIDFIEGKIPLKTKPRIVMLHNEIRSAVLQNGLPVDETHLTAIPPKLLKKLDADYYACGHIHEPQKLECVGNCYYSGSVYPKDFGEHHDASYNIITIEDGKVDVQIKSFGFPMNKTYKLKLEELEDYKKRDFKNQRVKLQIEIDKLFKKNYSKDDLQVEIKEKTGAEDVIIQFIYKKEDSQRSKDVAEKEDVVDKFKAYASLNGIKATDTMINKLQVIKENLTTLSFIPNDTYELEYISLRGAIGIKDGIGLDEINIDFTKYNEGVLCLLGQNGAGKSTLIENCHPYPHMLTRSGSLKDHFCLKDSHRILIYRTSKGRKIKITMQIDGVAKSIGTKYFVEEMNEGESWIANASVDGGNESYVNFVNTHFGDVSLFLRTSFYAKKQIKTVPDLALATKGEKMTLFSTLAGTDYLSTISDMAKDKMKEIKETIADIKGQLAGFDNIKERIENYNSDIKSKTVELSKYEELIEIDRQELDVYKDEQKKYDEAITSVQFVHREIASKNAELDNIRRDILLYQSNIDELEEQLKDIDSYRKQLKWYEDNTQIRKELLDKKMTLTTKRNSTGADLSTKQLKYNQINNRLAKIIESKMSIEANLSVLKKSISDKTDICPTCGQPLNAHKQEQFKAEQKQLKDNIHRLENDLKDLLNKEDECNTEISTLNLEGINKAISELNTQIAEIDNDINTIDSYMETIDLAEIKNVIENTEPLLKDNKKRLNGFTESYKKVEKELNELEERSKNLPTNFSDKIKRLERGIIDSADNIATLKAEIKVITDNIESLKGYEDQIKSIDEKIKGYNKDLKEYDILCTAFGNNGIQAYELDNVAPEISAITNEILEETYGDRFRVSFSTQRDTSDGRKIDDFIINVFDSNSGREKKLEMLSSGESVWIKQALYFAFSVIRTKKTGFCFKTRFLDESDGELDAAARSRFVKMIEIAHKMCNATLTILITHSVEVKDLVEQKIELTSPEVL